MKLTRRQLNVLIESLLNESKGKKIEKLCIPFDADRRNSAWVQFKNANPGINDDDMKAWLHLRSNNVWVCVSTKDKKDQ